MRLHIIGWKVPMVSNSSNIDWAFIYFGNIQEFIYKTSAETTAYTSNSIRYETYKTFAVKIALVANTTYDMPRVKDMRAIALD